MSRDLFVSSLSVLSDFSTEFFPLHSLPPVLTEQVHHPACGSDRCPDRSSCTTDLRRTRQEFMMFGLISQIK